MNRQGNGTRLRTVEIVHFDLAKIALYYYSQYVYIEYIVFGCVYF